MKRIAIILFLLAIVIGGILGWQYYRWIYHENTPDHLENAVILISDDVSVIELADQLEAKGYIINKKSFLWVADKMKFTDSSVKTGRYIIPKSINNRDLISKLRLAEQSPVELILRPSMTLELMAGRVTSQLMIDSMSLINYIRQDYLPNSEYTEATILSLFIPNTYEVFWNISAERCVKRFETEHQRFWNTERTQAADELGLSPLDVYILASIVERETQSTTERPIIAGIYINRLNRNMHLEADPTVLYAIGDFTIRRVLYSHLEVDSPYNTYKYPGLPPGPIVMPSMQSILAVLSPAEHNYIFFCVKAGGSGHAFASTLREHNNNARAYHRWLNSRGIK